MAESISAEQRTTFGKGAARKLRAAGQIPAVVYGHGSDPVHVSLPGHEMSLIIRRANAVLDLRLEGRSTLALVKDVQRDPVRQIIEHVDLVLVRAGETVQVEVPLALQGEPASGTVATLDVQTLLLDVLATAIPEHIVVDVADAAEGTHVTAGDVTLPEGASLAGDPTALVVAVLAEAAPEPTEAEAADETEAEDAEAGEPVAAE